MADRRTFQVEAPEPRADRFLATALAWSRSRVRTLFDEGRVRRGETVLRPKDAVAAGDALEVDLPEEVAPQPLRREDLGVEVLFEDDHVIVVNKPADLVVHPSRGHTSGTLVNALLDRVDEELDPNRPGIVHRLDKGTSGVLVVARTQRAQTALQEQFERHTVERRYVALVWGTVRDLTGTIDAPLGRHPTDRLKFSVKENGRRSVTHWSRLAVSGSFSLVECRLETGRTHQVRVHLHHLGHPVVGDPLYRHRGTPPAPWTDIDHQLLHAFRLGFDHPDTGARVTFEAPPPPDYLDGLARAGIAWPVERRPDAKGSPTKTGRH